MSDRPLNERLMGHDTWFSKFVFLWKCGNIVEGWCGGSHCLKPKRFGGIWAHRHVSPSAAQRGVDWSKGDKWTGAVWEKQRGRYPEVLTHGWIWPQETHLTCCWPWLTAMLGMDVVCVGNKSFKRMWKRLRFRHCDSFSQWLTKAGEVWWEAVMSSTPIFLPIKKCQGVKTNITRKSEVQKNPNQEVHDFSHRSLLQMWIFPLVCNEVFGVFSKCKIFWTPSGLTQCLLFVCGCEERHLG